MTHGAGGRGIAYDLTHLVTRLNRVAFTGIDQVDVAYARYLVSERRLVCGTHFGLNRPHRLSPDRAAGIIEDLDRRLDEKDTAASLAWSSLRAWIRDEKADRPSSAPTAEHHWRDWLRQSRLRITMDGSFALPEGAIYLNVAQHALEFHRFFRWLDRRPDVMPVFFVHDLLPLDMPEFFRSGYQARFERRFQTILRHARAIITTSQIVRDRIDAEYTTRGRRRVPIHVQPLASPLGPPCQGDRDESLLAHPYFVIVSTIEPRKNHLMLLHAWRAMTATIADPPKLVIVGTPGWDCEETLAVLTRCPSLARCVRRVSGLPPAHLRMLIANARALLMPSFAEGYGMPVVEALTLGTPVIASDIPVFHEVSQGRATFVSPIDGVAWSALIAANAGMPGSAPSANDVSASFEAPTWAAYFDGVAAFLARL